MNTQNTHILVNIIKVEKIGYLLDLIGFDNWHLFCDFWSIVIG